MVVVFPIAKLCVLFVCHISRPVALMIKQRAVNNNIFRKYFCILPAQHFNKMQVKMRMNLMKIKSRGLEIANLSENR
jgi:hypothetical protein